MNMKFELLPETSTGEIRYITIGGGPQLTKQAFALLEKSIDEGATLERVTPRVDSNRKKYYWLIYVIRNNRIAFKLYINEQTEKYVYAYLNGTETDALTEINFLPDNDVENAEQWLTDHRSKTSEYANRHTEEISMYNDKIYHTHICHFPKGKMVYPGNVIESISEIL